MKRAAKHLAHQAVAKGLFSTGAHLRNLKKNPRRHIILSYHRIIDPSFDDPAIFDPEITVTASAFFRHMRFVEKHFDVRPVEQVVHVSKNDQQDFQKPLCGISFDDGLIGVHKYAFPILKKMGMTATVFASTQAVETLQGFWADYAYRSFARALSCGERKSLANIYREHGVKKIPKSYFARDWVESLKELSEDLRNQLLRDIEGQWPNSKTEPTVMSWEQLRELKDSGFEIGGHTVSHALLDTLPEERKVSEIQGCRDAIQANLNFTPSLFCYPNGRYDSRTVEAVMAAGFQMAFTDKAGTVAARHNDWTVPRLCIGNAPYGPTFAFACFVTGIFPQYR